MPTRWFTHEVTWVLPSGERRPGRIGISEPEPGPFDPPLQIADADKLWRCWYVLEPLQRASPGPVWHDELSAMYYAFTMLGHYVYWELCRGTRIIYPNESGNPLTDTARLLASFGPLIRAHGNPRGVADPEGKLAELEVGLAGLMVGSVSAAAKSWLVEMPVMWIDRGVRRPGLIAVGTPELVPGCNGEATCVVVLDGLDAPQRRVAIRGDGAFQALLLAIHHIEARLRAGVSEGLRVTFPDGEGDEDPDAAMQALLSMFRPFG